jgi:hypothetical protein
VESEPWGRARRSFLWRPRLELAAVDLTLASGTAVGAGQATLFSCQVSQWGRAGDAVFLDLAAVLSGLDLAAVDLTSALSTEERASG